MTIPRSDRIGRAGRVRVFDAGPTRRARYTVLFDDLRDTRWMPAYVPGGPRMALALSDDPATPGGVSVWTVGAGSPLLGRRIAFDALPPAARAWVTRAATALAAAA